ncbi:MAG: DUF308 domain-containing protein [Clostridia bacterium]|nr:DUF308 domain-containing protein [Clostridia bacterium]
MKVFAIITGILTAILGVVALAIPFRTFLGIGWLLGAVILFNGIAVSVNGFAKLKNAWQGVLGILIALGGAAILFNTLARAITDALLAYFVASIVVIKGINLIVSSVKKLKESKGWGICGIIFGVLSILLGICAAMHPILTMISVGYLIAAVVLMQGINTIIFACSISKS